MGSIKRMGAADTMLLLILAVADFWLVLHLHHRRARRMRTQRISRSLRRAIQREVGEPAVSAPAAGALVLQRAS